LYGTRTAQALQREAATPIKAGIEVSQASSGAFMSIIDLLPEATVVKAVPAGEMVFTQGDSGDVMFVVIEGEIEILLDGKTIETVRAGGLIGEMALIDLGPRSATALCRTRCLLSPVDQERFRELVVREPDFALQVMRVLARRLRRMDIAR
jgi:CRP-like cAMP-binding protein